MPLLLLLVACGPSPDEPCSPSETVYGSLADETPLGPTGDELLARAQALAATTLTWATGETASLSQAVDSAGEPYTCQRADTRGNSASAAYVPATWHLPVVWSLATDDGRLDVTIDAMILASTLDVDPFLQAESTDAAGIDLGGIDPAAWRDFTVTLTTTLPGSGATGQANATGWQDAEGPDTYLDEPLASW